MDEYANTRGHNSLRFERRREKKKNGTQSVSIAIALVVFLNMIIYSNKNERKTVCQIYELGTARHGITQKLFQTCKNDVVFAQKTDFD